MSDEVEALALLAGALELNGQLFTPERTVQASGSSSNSEASASIHGRGLFVLVTAAYGEGQHAHHTTNSHRPRGHAVTSRSPASDRQPNTLAGDEARAEGPPGRGPDTSAIRLWHERDLAG
jgi:hypothetical protein